MIISQEAIDILKFVGGSLVFILLWVWCVIMFKFGFLGGGQEIGMLGMFIVPVVVFIAIVDTIFSSNPVVITINHLYLSVPSLILIVINFFIIRADDRHTKIP